MKDWIKITPPVQTEVPGWSRVGTKIDVRGCRGGVYRTPNGQIVGRVAFETARRAYRAQDEPRRPAPICACFDPRFPECPAHCPD